jgi:hypothetical protein
MVPVEPSDRHALLTFAAYALELAQGVPTGAASRDWLLDRADDALELVDPLDAAEVEQVRRNWLEPLRAGATVVGEPLGDS